LHIFVGESGYRDETVGSMTYRGPLGSLFSSSFLNPVTVKVDFGTTGSFFCFLDTLGLSSKIHFIPKIPLLSPSLVKTCFKSTIPKKLQVSPFLCGGCSIAEPENIIEVGEVDKGFKIDEQGSRGWENGGGISRLGRWRYDFGGLSCQYSRFGSRFGL
jgi:hypothetical protein